MSTVYHVPLGVEAWESLPVDHPESFGSDSNGDGIDVVRGVGGSDVIMDDPSQVYERFTTTTSDGEVAETGFYSHLCQVQRSKPSR